MRLISIIFFFLFSLGTTAQGKLQPVDYVRPLAGTETSRWFFFNTASRPFGMVNLSPDTRTGGDWMNGYLYGDTKIRSFSHIHCWQLYGIATMPFTGKPKGHLGLEACQSDFSHNEEEVKVGYYSVNLKTYNIKAELTSTNRVGMHRYQFPKDSVPGINFDLTSVLMDKISSAHLKKTTSNKLEGSVTMAPTIRRPKPFTVFFVAEFSEPITKFGKWRNKQIVTEVGDSISGGKVGAWLEFSKTQKPVLMKVAISYTSISAANANMKQELNHWDFDRVVGESRKEWNSYLGRIEVSDENQLLKQRFYTDLWHTLLGRRTISDCDGAYPDNTGSSTQIRYTSKDIHGQPYPHYNFDGFWHSQWNLNLLWGLAYPEITNGFCNTMLDMYRNGGLIPRGPAGGNYTFVMIGDAASPFMASAYQYGIRNWDTELAWQGLRKNAFEGGIRDHAGYDHDRINPKGGGMKYYIERGYVPEGIEGNGMHKDGASMTLEYAYQDWCLSEFAKSLGKKDEAKLFAKRSQNYKNLWNPATSYMHPKTIDGKWIDNFIPIAKNKEFNTLGFCESNSMIYSHFVLQDPQGLIKLFGGKETYANRLEQQMENGQKQNFIVPHGEHGTAWADFENQPALGLPWMFNYAGKPWLSQKWVRTIKNALFTKTSTKEGYHGDEDQGQIGAFSSLMAMGLFDFQGGAAQRPTWQITAPVFDSITIHLNKDYYKGDTFKIISSKNNPNSFYINSAKLNGKKLNTFWFYHEDLIKGGELELELSDEPNKSWGKQ
jgi:predicted alpha-1,2-mannosidase